MPSSTSWVNAPLPFIFSGCAYVRTSHAVIVIFDILLVTITLKLCAEVYIISIALPSLLRSAHIAPSTGALVGCPLFQRFCPPVGCIRVPLACLLSNFTLSVLGL